MVVSRYNSISSYFSTSLHCSEIEYDSTNCCHTPKIRCKFVWATKLEKDEKRSVELSLTVSFEYTALLNSKELGHFSACKDTRCMDVRVYVLIL